MYVGLCEFSCYSSFTLSIIIIIKLCSRVFLLDVVFSLAVSRKEEVDGPTRPLKLIGYFKSIIISPQGKG